MRRIFIMLASIGLMLQLNSCALVDYVGGNWEHEPTEMKEGLSAEAKALIDLAFDGIDAAQLRDYHTHLVGIGAGEPATGASINPKLMSWAHPIHRVKTAVYLSAVGVTDLDNADAQFRERLISLIQNWPQHGKHHILGFDYFHNPDGTADLEKSEFYTPNEYVFRVYEANKDLFEPTISVHPYRKDALEQLEKWAAKGARYIKWLPNAMGMDASDPRLDDYYRKVRDLGMVILTHIGEEQAVESEDDQRLGNPLLFRRPLNMGVQMIMAHCGSLGEYPDMDDPEGKMVSAHDLFLRMMDNPKYDGLLFGDISAMTQFNRLPGPILSIMQRSDLHHRLVNGSDYPLPAINLLIRTKNLVEYGFITENERELLNEIYSYNPLLFDFVSKRTMRLPGTELKMPAKVFMKNPKLP